MCVEIPVAVGVERSNPTCVLGAYAKPLEVLGPVRPKEALEILLCLETELLGVFAPHRHHAGEDGALRRYEVGLRRAVICDAAGVEERAVALPIGHGAMPMGDVA